MKNILILLLFSPLFSLAQTGTLTGLIVDSETEEPLISANVTIGETGIYTDFDGRYSIELPYGKYTVRFSYVGFEDETQEVEINAPTVTLDVKMGGAKTFKEILVTADIAIERKTPVAFTNISPAKIEEELASQDIPMLLNSIPGSYATQSGGGDGDARITIRGFNQRNVAIMLDGIPVNDMENGWVYWSNWFGLDLVTKTIQVQRGLGASKLAIPSVGGTVNILTKGIESKRSIRFKQEVGTGGYTRSTFGYSSGRLENGWGVSVAGSYKQGNGWVDGTFTKGYFYYLRLDKEIGNHLISVSGFGAPQSHGQRSFRTPVALYDTTYAKEIGVSQEAIDNVVTTFLTNGEGRQFNQHIGELNGEMINTRQNYYHKPQMSLRHSWNINERTFLSNVAYLSIGSGGGVAPLNTMPKTEEGVVDLQTVYDGNSTPSFLNPDMRSTNILRASVNNHFWYGLLSTIRFQASEELTLSGGMDIRKYEGQHYRVVHDLLGGEYFQSRGNARIDESTSRLQEGDIFDYNNTGYVDWGGVFGLAEYSRGKWSTFLNVSGAVVNYALEDFMNAKEVALADTTFLVSYGEEVVIGDETYTIDSPEAQNQRVDGVTRPSFTIKSGASYNVNNQNNVFFNAGYLSRPARFSNAIQDNRFNENGVEVGNAKNEIIYAVEAGYNFKSPTFTANVNAYWTNWLNKPLDRTITVLRDPEDPDSERIPLNVNGIAALHRGIELEFAYRPMRKLTIEGIASFGDWIWNSATSAQLPDGRVFEFDATGVHVGDAAQVQLGGLVRFEPIKGLYFKFKTTYFGKNFSDFRPEALQGDNVRRDSWQLPNYNLVDFHSGYNFRVNKTRMSLRFNVLNILDTRYIGDATNNDGFTQSYNNFDANSASVFFGLGRRWNASWQISF